ncbi:leucine-rich repeat protein [Clostridium saccharobutylicum]|uniref:Leucine rich repeat protein n=1 Tax=Clostridium saccharobutylicum DSM 13864 TaxID=1345695 RepID=U5MYC5_CLOSA|nr:leucine-rich repeat protein [Clostridium saccharobutylicum]AGX44457.1 leucine rich repeat protein [Clostridium saccharobutylicum DSM 13864]AQR91751.1 toxin B [Clostridium saccharobutylicum]AQS01653.1 toxin B [Clostridium saccharobutylicum]AQS11263.1 toxin B [Clostridium saccharobutylicum]AQS15636.1 toxin B [Clostridium saccharobutylicum]
MLNRNKIISGVIIASTVIGGSAPQVVYADDSEFQISSEDNWVHYTKDSSGKTWEYCNLEGGGIMVDGTFDIDSYMEVPETLDGKKVVFIDRVAKVVSGREYKAENDKRPLVTKIKLPSTVKKIDCYAFAGCTNLTDVEMPENVEVEGGTLDSFANIRINGKLHSKNFNSGWNTIGTDKYYLNSNGNLQTGWMDLNGRRYYFYSSGQMATGFINLGNGSFYYLDPTTGDNMGNLVTGWKSTQEHWYYFNLAGQGDKEKGFMQTGWLYNNGSWYYFYSNGQMATGFINLNGAYYYLDESNSGSIGIMKTGWQYMNDSWYYFNRKGDPGYEGMMRKGWQKIDGTWYYFYYGDGKMAQDTWIDGYYVNSSGAWVG